jgi:hypothetical protein
MRAAVIVCALVAGCGTQGSGPSGSGPFLLETTDCALVNNFMFDGAPTSWTDCRVYWSGQPTNIMTVELTVPATTGSFLAPGPGWVRASVHVPAGSINGGLTPTTQAAGALPTTVADDKIALDLTLPFCGNLGMSKFDPIATMADVGDESVSFSMSLSGTCPRSGTAAQYSGGVILTAAAQDGAMTNADPATPVTTP